MPTTTANAEVAAVFDEIADLLEIQGENAFRVRAYRNAARLIEGLGASVGDMLAKGEDLTELPGIGKDLAGKMREIVETGSCAAHQELRRQLPATITTLLRIPGLGPKRVQILYRRLDIGTAQQLEAAAREGRIRALPGFGEKTEALILQALGQQVETGTRFPLAVAARSAEPLKAYLAQTPGVKDVMIAGSYRRFRETVGDIDLVVTAARSKAAMDRFCAYPEVARVVSQGATRATVILANGLQVDMRVVPAASFGAALYYFTGSKAHNIATRRIAQQRGLKINEYGVFRGKRRIAGDTEASVFNAIGLPFIAPELRENRGEIEAAQAGALPALVTREQLQGDLHVRAPSDKGELRDWIDAARRRGLHYFAVTLPARAPANYRRTWMDEIDRLNETVRGFTLLRAVEVDIREDGTLDAPAALLREFDLVIAAINAGFNLPRATQTERLRRALDHPAVTLLARPSGRSLGDRPGYEVDMPQIIRAARERGCFLELDSQPERLDLPDVYCRLAKDEGVPIAITSAARAVGELDYLAHGVGQARRGWLEPKDVVNTRTLKELKALLNGTRGS